MKLFVFALFGLSIIFGTAWRNAQGFVIPSRPLPKPSSPLSPRVGTRRLTPSTTALYKSKTIACRTSYSPVFEKTLTSRKSLQTFCELNGIFYFVDETSSRPQHIGCHDFAALQNGAMYKIVTIAECLTAATAQDINGPDSSSSLSFAKRIMSIVARLKDTAPLSLTPEQANKSPALATAENKVAQTTENWLDRQIISTSRTKIFRYLDSHGMYHRAQVSSESSFDTFRETKGIECFYKEGDIEIYSYEDLDDGSIYTLEKQEVDVFGKLQLEPSSFNYSTMRPPEKICLLPRVVEPKFVCTKDWIELIEKSILVELDNSDPPRGERKVPPMVLSRCSSGGKTRSLNEVSHHMIARNQSIAVISITFCGHTILAEAEQADPLQALCQRIAFESVRDEGDLEVESAFLAFQAQNYYIDPVRIAAWLGSCRALLVVDELNRVEALGKKIHDLLNYLARLSKPTL